MPEERRSALRVQAAESGKRHRRRPGRRRATRDGGTPKRAVRAELVCLPPRASGLTPRPSPSRGEGRPRGQVIVSMILRVIQRDQRSWMRARRRHKPSPPLINLSAIERKHNSTSCALWSLPRIFSFFSFQEGSCRRLAAVYKACFSVPVYLYFYSAVSPDA